VLREPSRHLDKKASQKENVFTKMSKNIISPEIDSKSIAKRAKKHSQVLPRPSKIHLGENRHHKKPRHASLPLLGDKLASQTCVVASVVRQDVTQCATSRSRSGRVVVPPVAFWENQYKVTNKHGVTTILNYRIGKEPRASP
jgi:hypothetical protein